MSEAQKNSANDAPSCAPFKPLAPKVASAIPPLSALLSSSCFLDCRLPNQAMVGKPQTVPQDNSMVVAERYAYTCAQGPGNNNGQAKE